MSDKPNRDIEPDVDFEDDEEEMANEQLQASRFQKIFWPFYIFLFLVWLGIACVPFLIMYTVGWMAWDAAK